MLRSFRLELSMDYAQFAGRDLDWDGSVGRWVLSNRERGSVTWETGMGPRSSDLEELRSFFYVPESVSADALVEMSPPRLVELHTRDSQDARLKIQECPWCERHWDIYRHEEDRWRFYGGDCRGPRSYGETVDPPNVDGS